MLHANLNRCEQRSKLNKGFHTFARVFYQEQTREMWKMSNLYAFYVFLSRLDYSYNLYFNNFSYKYYRYNNRLLGGE